MVTPRVPSANVRVVPGAPTVGVASQEIVYLAGPVGAGAPAQIETAPTNPLHSLAAVEEVIGRDGPTHDAAGAILRQANPGIVIMPTAANPTHSLMTAALNRIYEVDPSPTKVYASTLTDIGEVIGDLKAQIAADDTSLEFNVDPDPSLPAGDVIVIDGEYIQIGNETSPGVYTVLRGQYGTAASAHAANDDIHHLASSVNSTLEEICEELECLSVASGPDGVQEFRAWSDVAGNTKPNVLGAFNHVNGELPGAWILGAAIAQAASLGPQRGLEFAPVKGVTTLAHRLSYSIRAGVDSDLQTVVGAYGAAITRRGGAAVVIGDTFRGIADARKIWSVAQVIHALDRHLNEVQQHYIGAGADSVDLNRLANQLQREGRRFVGRGEIRALSAVPHPTKNTAAALAAGEGYTSVLVTPIIPLKHLEADLTLQEPIALTIG